jgi:TonB-dependent SusC/RagA subfamily outer membrane receptor
MKKNVDYDPIYRDITKLLRIMKITALFVFLFSMHIYAVSFGQSSRLSLTMNSTFREVIERLEQESGYHFVLKYNESILDKKVNVRYINETIDRVMADLLKDTGYTYKIVDKYIAITSVTEPIMQMQQIKKVSGKVTDEKGMALPGVTVVVKGTTNGTITGADGSYVLTDVNANAVLVFSFVGMKTQEFSLDGKTTLDVVMSEETIGIEEVVAVGYGTIKKSDLTGAISQVKTSDMENRTIVRPEQALQGKTAGVQIIQTSGAPGKSATVRIRGFSSNASSDPLYVVDGLRTSDIGSIDPNNIESIEVLKDAASAAIYGAQAGNGVVLITTKRGKRAMAKSPTTFSM